MASIPQQPGLISWKQNDKLFWMLLQREMKKSAQRRCKHCALAAVRRSKNFRPATDPLPGGTGWTKFNQLEMVATFTYKPSLMRIDARNFELSWQQTHKQTHPQTHTQTHRQDRIQYTAPLSLARSVITCNCVLWCVGQFKKTRYS